MASRSRQPSPRRLNRAKTERNDKRRNGVDSKIHTDVASLVPRRPRWVNCCVDLSARNLGQHRSSRNYFINEKEIIRDWTPRDPEERRYFLQQKAAFAQVRDPNFISPDLESGWNGRAGTEASSYNHKVFAYRRFVEHDYRPQAAAAMVARRPDALDPRVLPSTWSRGITSSTGYTVSPFARENVDHGEDVLLDVVGEQTTARLTAVAVVNSNFVPGIQQMDHRPVWGDEKGASRVLPSISRGGSTVEQQPYQPWIPYHHQPPPNYRGAAQPGRTFSTPNEDRSLQLSSTNRVMGNLEEGFYSRASTAAMASRAIKLLNENERERDFYRNKTARLR